MLLWETFLPSLLLYFFSIGFSLPKLHYGIESSQLFSLVSSIPYCCVVLLRPMYLSYT